MKATEWSKRPKHGFNVEFLCGAIGHSIRIYLAGEKERNMYLDLSIKEAKQLSTQLSVLVDKFRELGSNPN